jgi:hypothetical protein
MRPWFEIVTDLVYGAEPVRARRYGVIEVRAGQLERIRLRPFPTRVLLWQPRLFGAWRHRYQAGDWCRLYYNQPRGFDNFLSLVYVVSGRDASFATFRTAVTTLDQIGELKQVDALLCDASNGRISDRLLHRWGWVPHAPMPWARNYIKRLEGRVGSKQRAVDSERRGHYLSQQVPVPLTFGDVERQEPVVDFETQCAESG